VTPRAPRRMFTRSVRHALPISRGRALTPFPIRPLSSRVRLLGRFLLLALFHKYRNNYHRTRSHFLLFFGFGDSCYGTYGRAPKRSEEHTSELQSREKLVCRLLL